MTLENDFSGQSYTYELLQQVFDVLLSIITSIKATLEGIFLEGGHMKHEAYFWQMLYLIIC